MLNKMNIFLALIHNFNKKIFKLWKRNDKNYILAIAFFNYIFFNYMKFKTHKIELGISLFYFPSLFFLYGLLIKNIVRQDTKINIKILINANLFKHFIKTLKVIIKYFACKAILGINRIKKIFNKKIFNQISHQKHFFYFLLSKLKKRAGKLDTFQDV